MSFLRGVVAEFRQRRLWPVALLLLAGLIAVPVLLAKQPGVPSVAPLPVAPASGKAATVPVLNVTTGPSQTPLKGSSRDPFTPQKQAQQPSTKSSTTAAATTQAANPTNAKSTAAAPTLSGSSATPTASGRSGGNSGFGNGGSPSSSSSGTLSSTPPVALPSTPPITLPMNPTGPSVGAPGPRVLSSTESYAVSVKLTGEGPARTIQSLQRDSSLPSADEPLLIELGVLKGAKKVLFVVNPGTTLSGPGACTPGPIDCEILAVPVGSTETLSVLAPGAAPATYHLTVSGVKITEYPDAAAALAARRDTAKAGREMLATLSLSALTLFRYDVSQGAIIDQRNLTAGDS